MSQVLNAGSWAAFVSICVTKKNLNLQHVDMGDRHLIIGPDANGINWQIELPKKIEDPGNPGAMIDNPDALDFEQNHAANCNWAVGTRQHPFATGDFDFAADAVSAEIAAEQAVAIEYTFAETLYITGGSLILSGSAPGDWVEAHVVHPIAGVVKNYIKKRFVPASPADGPSQLMLVQTHYAGIIPAGLKLRMIYHSTGLLPVKAYLNLDLHRPI